MPGEVGPPTDRYVLARRVLLDALDALGSHGDALILVGAQAIYLHVGDADLNVPPYTEDADFALDPSRLEGVPPQLVDALHRAGFKSGPNPGTFLGEHGIPVDLLAPAALVPKGNRGADLGFHGEKAARITRGLEGATVDNGYQLIRSLEDSDDRERRVLVAGPAALLVSKLQKLSEREGTKRLKPKDALDVLRLLKAADNLPGRLRFLRDHELSGDVARHALQYLEQKFTEATAEGSRWAAEACEGLEDTDVVAAQTAALARRLLKDVEEKEMAQDQPTKARSKQKKNPV